MTKKSLTPITPELYEALGRIVVAWSAIEAILAEFLSLLIPADPVGMYVLNQTASIDQKMKWIRTLSALRLDPSILVSLEGLFGRIDEARSERNDYVHGLWATNGCSPGEALVQTVNLNRAEIIRTQFTTRPDLDDLIQRLEEIRHDLAVVGQTLGFGPHLRK